MHPTLPNATSPRVYEGIDSDTEFELTGYAAQIKKQKASGLKTMLEMGQSLLEAQKLLANHSGGTFVKWVESECEISSSAAYRYINAALKFSGFSFPSLGKLTAEAMYTLSSPSAPPNAVKEAQKQIDKGVTITEKVAKQLVKPTEPKPRPSANGSAAVLVVTPEQQLESLRPSTEPPKAGTQKRSPANRKEALLLLGKLVRALDRLGLSADLDSELKAINKALKDS